MDHSEHHASSFRLIKYAGWVFAAGMVVGLLSFAYQVFVPVDPKGKPMSVYIPRGTPAYQIALKLKEAGLVRHPRFVQILMGLRGSTTHLKAGEYEFSPSMSAWTMVNALRTGRVKLYPFLVREGASIREIARDLERQGFGQADRFWALTRRPYLARRMGVPAPLESIEGYLFPDTYYVSREMSEYEIVMMMVNNFAKKFDAAMERKTKEIKLTRHEVVTLASIIEGEAEVDEERAKISGVFHNRLRKGQKLESCVTVLYAIGRRKRLFEKDLMIESIYNTYKHPGLPPTPINNPGMASLNAAMTPAETPYLYFVSRGDKKHFFAVSWKEHEANIKKAKVFRADMKKKKAAKPS